MTAVRQAPFPRQIGRAQLGPLEDAIGNTGQCKGVHPLREHPDYLFKEYRDDQLEQRDELRLARLVRLPDEMTAADRELLLRSTCWPLARVVEHGRTTGVVIPKAPPRFWAALRGLDDEWDESSPLLLSRLAASDEEHEELGLHRMSLAARVSVCGGLIETAALFERHGIVYGDWGYKNILWSRSTLSVYFIDTDACSFGPQKWVESFGFEDPLTPAPQPVDTYTDRLRCATAVAACLVGAKDPGTAFAGLEQLWQDACVQRITPVLLQANAEADREKRPAIADLWAAYRDVPHAHAGSGEAAAAGAGTGNGLPTSANVLGWDEVEPVRTPPAGPRPAGGSRMPAEPIRPPARAQAGARPPTSHRPTPARAGTGPSRPSSPTPRAEPGLEPLELRYAVIGLLVILLFLAGVVTALVVFL